MAASRTAACRPAGRTMAMPRPAARRVARATLSSTGREVNRLECWKVLAIPALALAWSGRPVTSRPSKLIRPAVGRRLPVTSANRVDLPAPLGPMTACRAPAATDSETPSRATSDP
jgi:hypothetical protein